MRNRYARKILCITTVICAAAMIGCGTKTVKDSDVVMEIAGQPVVKAEYQMILSAQENVIKSKYDTDTANSEDFWTTGQDGESPLGQVMKLVESELKEKKAIAQLAGEFGIDTETDYLSIVSQMEQENDRREKADESGEVVYGLNSFGIDTYYDYIYTQVEYELTEKLKQKQDISEEELEKIYQENKEQYTSEISVKMLAAEMNSSLGMDMAVQVAEDLKENTDIQALSQTYTEVSFYEIELSSLNMQEGKSGAYMQRFLTASQMQQGEVCEPFAIGENLMTMRCLARSEHEVQPFEDVKGMLKDNVLSSLAREDLERRQNEAEVELKVTGEQLEKIALEVLK